MRPALRISKTDQTWRWYYEDYDLPHPARVLATSATDFPTWQEAEAAGRATYPAVIEVFRNVVRGTGTDYADSLPNLPWP